MEGINPQGFDQGEQDRYQNDDRGQGFHDAAHEKEKEIDPEENDIRVLREITNAVCNPLGNPLSREDPRKERSVRHEEHDSSGHDRRLLQDRPETLNLQFAIDQKPDHKGVENPGSCCFGRSENTRKDSPKDEKGHHEGRKGL